MDLSNYASKAGTQVAIIYANSQIAEKLGTDDNLVISGANTLYLSPVENVSGWIRKTLGGEMDDDDFSWGFSDEPAQIANSIKPKRRIRIACYSPLGGVGKTTASVMLGKLAQEAGHSVCIIESDNDNAGVLQALGAQSVTEGLGSLLEEEWEQYSLFENRAASLIQVINGIAVVPIGSDSLGLKCDQNNIGNLYEWVNKQSYNVVIYDLPPQLNELSVYKTLQEVDIVILVGEPTTKAEEKLLRFVSRAQGLQGLKDINSKLRLIINKYVATAGITDTEIAETVGIPLLGTIPVDPEHYYRMINDRKLSIPSNSPWRSTWGVIYPEDSAQTQSSIPKKKGGFFKSFLGLK